MRHCIFARNVLPVSPRKILSPDCCNLRVATDRNLLSMRLAILTVLDGFLKPTALSSKQVMRAVHFLRLSNAKGSICDYIAWPNASPKSIQKTTYYVPLITIGRQETKEHSFAATQTSAPAGRRCQPGQLRITGHDNNVIIK